MTARALVSVFKEWPYALVAIIVALCVFVVATWLPNLGLIWRIAASPSVALLDKATILASFVGSIATNFTIFSALYMSLIAVLFGINAAMLIYYLKQRQRAGTRTGALAGIGGLASGLVGVGCAACGTLVLGPILSFFGAAGLLALLPFEGQEFGLSGVALLGISIAVVAKKITEPPVCAVIVGSNE